MCSIKMETEDGGNCKASVECADGVTNEYYPDGEGWSVCFVGGQQFFTDDRIGDFSITFSEKDGEGEGLTNPILQLAYVGDWMQFPVADLAPIAQDSYDCEGGMTPLECDEGPFICQYGDMGNSYIFDSRLKRWECGMPMIGKGGPVGTDLDSNAPVDDSGYAPGWCVAHITHYQKPDPVVDSYSLEVTIYDNNENAIGDSGGKQGPSVSVASLLPWTLEVSTGNIDDDPVYFAYSDQQWDSTDESRCSVGAYDSGSRQMDCGFTC